MLKALVVGLGQIGMGYDLDLDPDDYVLSHSRAFFIHPAYQLVGAIDSDPARRARFEQRYGVASYPDISSAMTNAKPDVIAVATPTATHAQVINDILSFGKSSVLLCEKPISSSFGEAQAVVNAAEAANCPLYVNYVRIADQGVAEVKAMLSDHRIRGPVKGVLWYSKGLFNNGSHFVNLLQHWLGSVTSVRVLKEGRLWQGSDPEPDLILTFDEAEIMVLAAQEENFSHYTLELIASNGRLRYEQGGAKIIWQPAISDMVLPSYRILDPEPVLIPTDLDRIQWHVVDQLAHAIAGRQANICTGAQGLATIRALSGV